MTICPCCNQPMPGTPPMEALEAVSLSAFRRKLVDMLIRVFPATATMDDLLWEMYGRSEPLNAERVIKVTICRLRQELAPYGWTIRNGGGTGKGHKARYRLEKVGA